MVLNPAFELGRELKFRFHSFYGIHRGSSKCWIILYFLSAVDSRVG